MAIGVVVDVEELRRLVELNTRGYLPSIEKEEIYYAFVYSVSPSLDIKSGVILAYMDTTDVVYYSGLVFNKSFIDAKKELMELKYLEEKKDTRVGDVVKAYHKYALDLAKKKFKDLGVLKNGWIFVDGIKPTDVMDFF